MKNYLSAVVVMILAGCALAPAATTPATATAPAQIVPASRLGDLAARFLTEIQDVATSGMPGAEGFAAGLAGVLRKHGFNTPEALRKAAPSATLPKLTREQIDACHGPSVDKLLNDLLYPKGERIDAAEMALRADLLEAFCEYAPDMSLRLAAAQRLLQFAKPEFARIEQRLPVGVEIEPRRVVETVKRVLLESLAAANDGRDPFSLKTLVGIMVGKVAAEVVVLDLISQEKPTKESIEKARKQWGDLFAALAKDADNEDVKRVVGNVRKYLDGGDWTALLQNLLVRQECKPVIEAFAAAMSKQDRAAFEAVLTPKGQANLAKRDMGGIVKEMFGEGAKQIRLHSLGMTQGTAQEARIQCIFVWVDAEGKEHTARPELSLLRTDKGWRIGEK